MGMYVSVRGWLEAGRRQRDAVEAVIAAARRELYSGGRWAFPERPFNWTLYVFYGGDIREAELPWLRGQVESMAALPPVDDDGDMPSGCSRSATSVAGSRRSLPVARDLPLLLAGSVTQVHHTLTRPALGGGFSTLRHRGAASAAERRGRGREQDL
jgi:hypothetical protein